MSDGDEGAVRSRTMLAAVNGAIDSLHRSLHLPDSDFHCECGDPRCKERVTLTREEYEARSSQSRPILAPQHGPDEARQEELQRLHTEVRQLQAALDSRVIIEQAKGVLAERHGLPLSDAFEVLRETSRTERRRLADVCAEVLAGVPPHDRMPELRAAPASASNRRNG